MVGFEPTVHCTKNSCLTTWLHPSSEGLDTAKVGLVQALFCKEMRLFFKALFMQEVLGLVLMAFSIDNSRQGRVGAGVNRLDLGTFV